MKMPANMSLAKRTEFGPLRFSLRKVADGSHVLPIPHATAVDWFHDMFGTGREHFNPLSPAHAAWALYVEYETTGARRVVGWDHADGWPVVDIGQAMPVRA